MRLSDLINGDLAARDPALGALAASGALDVEIAGVTADSRAVRPGFLFAALPGTKVDGRRFIADAVARGAAAVLTHGVSDPVAVPLIADDNPRRRLALVAARFHGRQPRHIAAVTGTNGKTSVADFTRQIWQTAGHESAAIGTLGLSTRNGFSGSGLTTPDPVALHAVIAGLVGRGIEHLALEASSHGLDQCRLDGVEVRAAAFTNLTRDHLDYHGTAAAYLDAKAGLFRRVLRDGGTAVLNADVPEADGLRRVVAERRLDLLTYGTAPDADLRIATIDPHPHGQTIEIVAGDTVHAVDLPLVGDFQAWNACAALGLALATGVPLADGMTALTRLTGVPGRMQMVGTAASGGPVFVDYAHTPDALVTALRALRPHIRGRLHVVFGCGGDRDPGKRPMMGAACADNADVVILTDDNPRSEDPAEIRRQARPGCPDAVEIGDRAEAIAAGIAGLGAADALVIAGKGHEPGQEISGRVIPFDDATVAREALAAAGGRQA